MYGIYGYDLFTSTEFQIEENSYAPLSPAIYGNIIVWEDYDIYGYDLSTDRLLT